ncbi:MAG: hypothetical protein WA900_05285 [Casimicrobiaceae bacterium]
MPESNRDRAVARNGVLPGDEVDEIRVNAGDGRLDSTPVVAVWHGHLVGSSVTLAAQAQPIWVMEMSARAKAAQYRVR